MMIKATTDTQVKKGIKDIIKLGKEKNINIVGYTGLRLRVRPNKKGGATSTFIHRYTHPYTKKERKMTLGNYPRTSTASTSSKFIITWCKD